jgi:mannose-6-phosphate isomerase-like protein (cupin superfamily)
MGFASYCTTILLLFLALGAAAQTTARVNVIDTQSIPWDKGPAFRLSDDWRLKVLDHDAGRRVALAHLPPERVSKEKRHTHRFRQWFYFLQGDTPVFDYQSPDQKKARLTILRQGYFLDRPPGSVHGEEGNPRSQAGFLFLMYLGTSAPVINIPDEGPVPPGIEWKDDHIVDTRAMDWNKNSDGSLTKDLAFDVKLVLLPPGWRGSETPKYLRSAFVISGSGSLQASGSSFALHEGSFIQQSAGEQAQTEAGEVGCMFLEWYNEPASATGSAAESVSNLSR